MISDILKIGFVINLANRFYIYNTLVHYTTYNNLIGQLIVLSNESTPSCTKVIVQFFFTHFNILTTFALHHCSSRQYSLLYSIVERISVNVTIILKSRKK